MPFPYVIKPQTLVKRDAFLDAAQRLFASEGYEATSVSRIITELGVSKGAFYHYFEAKEDLIEALAFRYAQQSLMRADEILNDPTLDGFARLTTFLSTMRRHKVDTAADLRATFAPLLRAENLQLFERTQRAVNGVVRPILTRIIAEGVKEKAFDTPDAEAAADVILHILSGNRELIAELYGANSPLEFQQVADRVMAKFAYLGTVVDRILGLPEGSIALIDRDAICLLEASVAQTGTAA